MAAIPESCSHVLAEFECLSPLLSALRLDSSRLKCTCIGVSRKWLALGSSGGGLNLIQKDCWKQRLFLTHKEGAISCVAFCLHDEDYVAVATSQGLVVVWELNQERRGKPERIYVSSEHKGRKVTALCWDTNALRVFVGDHVGKVSVIKINSSKQGKAATAFVMFPIHIITTVDSRVVQLDFLDGRLLISSLTRSYLCDTEREKFWKIGNKERDGEYGACFFPVGKSGANQQSLIYCARPGSRIWEVNFEGEVLSTHQFKQLLSSPPLPVITIREDPEYNISACSPQSLAFPRLLYLSEHCIMTWTERSIYIFIPQNVQVLLWSEVKDIYDVAIYKNELFCLHTNGKVSHLSLLTVEKCVERLLRRSFWTLAAKMCCLFQNSIVLCRARKLLPVDKLEHLKLQLDLSTETDLITQLEELISKLEPLDSACSSRRSSISSHESFSVLDSGIYRVISRRNSQSDEDSCSLHSQTLSEDERLKEFHIQQEEEQLEHDSISHSSLVVDNVRNETFLPFSIPLPFRSPSPLVSLQAVKDSVSSFVRKTTEKIEKIGTLHLNPDRIRQEVKDEEPLSEVPAKLEAQLLEKEVELQSQSPEEDYFKDLKAVTTETLSRLQDPLVLLQPENLRAILLDWIPFLEETCGLKTAVILNNETTEENKEMSFQQSEDRTFQENVLKDQHSDPEDKELNTVLGINGESDNPNIVQGETWEENTNSVTNYNAGNIQYEQPLRTQTVFNQPYQINPPFFIPQNIKKDLTELTTLCFELNIYKSSQVNNEPCVLPDGSCVLASKFIRDYFFILDLERLKRCIINCHNNHPEVWDTYMEGLKELTLISPVTMALENGDMFKTLKLLVDLGPWDAPVLLAHAERFYKKFGETSLRPLTRFYPLIGPSDIKQICKTNPEHFLAYLDSLIKSKAEDERLSFLRSLLHPDSLQLEWLCLAMSHDAPHKTSTMDAQGNPQPHSHLFTWGYNQLIVLLLNLPADIVRKEKMTDICRSNGFWPGYLCLCLELDRRSEVFTKIVHLDDMELLNAKDGTVPKTIEEWKFLLCLVKSYHNIHVSQKDTSVTNGTPEWPNSVTVENVALLAARIIGPDRSLQLLQECDLVAELSERFAKICEILRIAEKRQRALIQSMLERCDRFLWSQQA
ncbi:Hermansky-Pudlak syndrome 5 protein isoform X1 [Crotalus tigris]|uniref:Hermansky-Pudlak syndrome 5 protein isoform X1 n=1 Tax=Crotalus tigris TaxID=88082 RepID=UPI00192F751B|nr:Hermansky-Pudlak syndrome 5 protein isoform X1 [Crotalus tigris]XP_039206726.1 Hermansky-Pudlak syndrome 5 protein isoform X1 [Crotalus tigris]XP_039206727.1 Hermansky-Pudlak syndrome 5 protein isoform X1 [Crotalus tigris]